MIGAAPMVFGPDAYTSKGRLQEEIYQSELFRLQVELVKMQEWVRAVGAKIVVIFEGRDAAGKGGVISRITKRTNARVIRVVALGTPSDRERTQWYFQRYVEQLPAGGEVVLFDRSWYNRAGVERVMNFATDAEIAEFMRACPQFEEMLQRSGVQLIKYWFSISDAEQERRFHKRLENPTKRWKLSPMDIESRQRWEDYSHAKDEMFALTDTPQSPWWVVDGDDKRSARLNCIAHLLSLVPYTEVSRPPVELEPRPEPTGRHTRPPIDTQNFVPRRY